MSEPPTFTLLFSEPWPTPSNPPQYVAPVLGPLTCFTGGRDWWRQGGIRQRVYQWFAGLYYEIWGYRAPPTFTQLVSEPWTS
jgi:hypothetical protein